MRRRGGRGWKPYGYDFGISWTKLTPRDLGSSFPPLHSSPWNLDFFILSSAPLHWISWAHIACITCREEESAGERTSILTHGVLNHPSFRAPLLRTFIFLTHSISILRVPLSCVSMSLFPLNKQYIREAIMMSSFPLSFFLSLSLSIPNPRNKDLTHSNLSPSLIHSFFIPTSDHDYIKRRKVREAKNWANIDIPGIESSSTRFWFSPIDPFGCLHLIPLQTLWKSHFNPSQCNERAFNLTSAALLIRETRCPKKKLKSRQSFMSSWLFIILKQMIEHQTFFQHHDDDDRSTTCHHHLLSATFFSFQPSSSWGSSCMMRCWRRKNRTREN